MKTYNTKELSKLFSVNRATIYKWLKRYKANLGEHLVNGPKGALVTEEGRAILATIFAPEQTPDESEVNARRDAKDDSFNIYKELVEERRVTIERMTATIEQMTATIERITSTQAEERRRSDYMIAGLTKRVEEQTAVLEYHKELSERTLWRRFVDWLDEPVMHSAESSISS